jgi:hypothetical protein
LTGKEKQTPLGWQGIFALLPTDWKLGAVGGDQRTGYLRIDDERMPRLQVKWAPHRIDLVRKRDEYVKRLTVGRRKRPTGLEVDVEAKFFGGRAKPKKDLVTFAWRGPQCGYGLMWNCETCGRSLIAQVTWRPEERWHDVAREVLASLEDHAEGGWKTWALDGLAFLAPEKYELGKWRWLTGYLEFNLAQMKRTLKVARWGIVSRILGGRTLSEWYQQENWRRRDVSFQVQEMELKGHDGIAVWGEVSGIKPRLTALAERALRRKPVVQFAGGAWHCPESNRLYLVETVDAGEGVALQGVVDSISCHAEAEA